MRYRSRTRKCRTIPKSGGSESAATEESVHPRSCRTPPHTTIMQLDDTDHARVEVLKARKDPPGRILMEKDSGKTASGGKMGADQVSGCRWEAKAGRHDE